MNEPVGSENHAVGAEDREERSLDSAANDVILSLVNMWRDVVVVFTNLNKFFEHSRGEVGDSVLVSSHSASIFKANVEGRIIYVPRRKCPFYTGRSTPLLALLGAFLDRDCGNTGS